MAENPALQGSVWRFSWRLLRYARRRWPSLIAVAMTMALDVVMNLARPWPMAIVVDSVLSDKPLARPLQRLLTWLPGETSDKETLLFWAVVATLVIFVLGWLLGTARALADVSLARKTQYDLAGDLLGHTQRLSVSSLSRRKTGDLVRRITTDSSAVSIVVSGGVLPILSSLATLASMGFVLVRLDPLLAVLSMAVVPVFIVAVRRLSAPLAAKDYAQQQAEGQMYSGVEESLSGLTIVKAFNQEPARDLNFRVSKDAALDATIAATMAQLRFKVWVATGSALGTALVMFFGGRQVLAGALSLGDLLIFMSYLASMYVPIETLMYTPSTVQGAAGSIRRVMELLNARPETTNKSRARDLRKVRGEVELRNVTYGYSEGVPVLRSVDVHAAPGEMIAVVGPTGAGKSTLAAMLLRFMDPWDGQVLVDGHDVRDLKLAALRRHVSLVLQESFLFPISIRENISYGRPRASFRDVENAARAANIHDFIMGLPNRYGTIVGERGATLSGGQRQRIAIARALLKNAPILVLDEPTSALDAHTESLLFGAVDRLMAGRTTFVIAHRLSTVRKADRILVLDEGRVVQVGTHEELLEAGGLYESLWRQQSGTVAESVALP